MIESVMLYLALNIFPKSPYSLEVCIPGIMRLNIPHASSRITLRWLKHGGLEHKECFHNNLTTVSFDLFSFIKVTRDFL